MVGNSISLLTTSTVTNSINFAPLTTKSHKSQQQQHLSYVRTTSPFSTSTPLHFKTNTLTNTHFSFHSFRGNTLRVYAKKKGGGDALLELSGSVDGNRDGNEEDEYEGMFYLPFENPFGKMKKWVENKPRGFGEGKVYDTSIEDKLLQEIEQSNQAQAANLNNLKLNPVKPGPVKDNQTKKAEVIPSGICVRVVNLPKKKNIHRDLKLAFKEVPGIVNIIPAVSGNKKTRDPISKGFAFVDFEFEEDASRFVQLFSGQSITFGKIQKQIKCEMMNSAASNSSDHESAGNLNSALQLTAPFLKEDLNVDLDMVDSSLKGAASHVSDDLDDEFMTAKLEDITANEDSISTSELNGGDSMEPKMELASSSFSSKKQDKHRANKKKIIAKGKGEKVPKLGIPGSAKRLKIKEKSMLTEVFSKYALSVASKEES